MYPCPGNKTAIGRAVVYSVRAAHAFSCKDYMLVLYLYTINVYICNIAFSHFASRYFLAGTPNFPSSCPSLVYLADMYGINLQIKCTFIEQENLI